MASGRRRLARQRGRKLATQTSVNQLVIEDMQDGGLVVDRAGREVQHNPEAQLLNDTMRALPNRRGLGTFLWEPTESGSWGQALFTRSGNTYTAIPARFEEYNALRRNYGL